MNEPSSTAVEVTWRPGSRRGMAFVIIKLPSGREVSHEVKAVSATARDQLVKRVCNGCPGIDQDAFASELERIGVHVAASESSTSTDRKEPTRDALLAQIDADNERALAETPEYVRQEAEAFLVDPRLIDLVLRDIQQMGVAGECELALTTYFVGTSRLLDKPLAAIVQGQTSTGKSYVPGRVAKLMPPEARLAATDITPNALYYASPGSLMNKFVLAGERRRGSNDEHAEATRALREIIESGELHKAVPFKTKDGRIETHMIWQPGPIAYMDSTTNTAIFDEDANRCLLLGTDESPLQTSRIVQAQARAARGCRADLKSVVDRHHALQRLLRRVEVDVPFAGDIATAIPTERQEARRAMPQLIGMIKAVALLHQHQRSDPTLVNGSTIEATAHDYVVARRLMVGPLSRSLGGGLPVAVTSFGERMRERFGDKVFTSTEALQTDTHLGNKSKVNEYLRTLGNAGVTECVLAGKGPQPAHWKVVRPIPMGSALWLPTVDMLGVCP